MSTIVLLAITGLGLAAMYFLVASGLSLIYGLMGVLNFAHGALITVGAYGMWYSESLMTGIPVLPRFILASTNAVVGDFFLLPPGDCGIAIGPERKPPSNLRGMQTHRRPPMPRG